MSEAAGHPSARPTARIPSLARPLLSLLAAVLCAAAVMALARLAVGTPSGQRLDQLILSGAAQHDGLLSQVAPAAVQTVSLPVIAALLGLTALLVLIRRRTALLLPLGVAVLGANLTTQVLKHLVVTREALAPGIEVTPNSFPSGHTTLAATAMIALVLAAGRVRILLAPLGAAWTLAAGIGTLVLGWHRPSDVIGAITVAAAWTFLALAMDGLVTRARLRRGGSAPARRRLIGRDRTTVLEVAVTVLMGLVGLAALGLGVVRFIGLGLPLDLDDPSQQLAAVDAMTALIGGGTAVWLALVLALRTPTSLRRAPADRVP
ncbi:MULTISPECIES: phosphatase PAP2 family protein [unclassified Brachybacterium]|uniref:phosphatase PAP2 family protein n=1 Tax=unclassified Brachybacterium TaxID=2623841 RepID=UPI001E5682FE|nr:phosphatase PAP2 family protein [Brachybacterium sp. UMB0905]